MSNAIPPITASLSLRRKQKLFNFLEDGAGHATLQAYFGLTIFETNWLKENFDLFKSHIAELEVKRSKQRKKLQKDAEIWNKKAREFNEGKK
tara:strand:- start:371 stop:646 length:276 start_codon:yes stop_codon:yes gene_type:complete